MPKNNFTSLLASLALLAFVGVIGYALSGGQASPSPIASFDSVDVGAESESLRVPPTGWKEYRQPTYALSFFYPAALTVQEFKESGGALTVTFEDVAGGQEFQIFIVPYADAEITTERFALDIPSGVKGAEEETLIDGIQGVKFFSQDRLLGETRETWFVHDGYLYEVTTHKELAAWMDQILSTWRFTAEKT